MNNFNLIGKKHLQIDNNNVNNFNNPLNNNINNKITSILNLKNGKIITSLQDGNIKILE